MIITASEFFTRAASGDFPPGVAIHVDGSLDLGGWAGTALPEGLTSIGGYLDLGGWAGTALPEGLTSIGGSLYLRGWSGTALPEGLTSIGGSLYLSGWSGTALPEGLTSIGGFRVDHAIDHIANLRNVARHALAAPDALKMRQWHCGTSHCIAGWAQALGPAEYGGPEGDNTADAGLILLGVEAAKHFYDSDEDAREWLAQFLEGAA